MAKFIFAYHGGKTPQSEAEGKKVMAEWQAWFGKIGAGLVDGGGPAGKSNTVSKSGLTDNGGANPISGYTIITAADYAEANRIAAGCPMVVHGEGSVEVAEILDM